MAELNVAYWSVISELSLDKVENVDLSQNVNSLKQLISSKINRPKDELSICFAGVILEDHKQLVDCGLRENCTVHVLFKNNDVTPEVVPEIQKPEIEEFAKVFRELSSRNIYKRILQEADGQKLLEKVMTSTPGLLNDSIAFSILQHPELLTRIRGNVTEITTKIIEKHPAIAYGARNIMLFTNELFTSSSGQQPRIQQPHIVFGMGDSDSEPSFRIIIPRSEDNLGYSLTRNIRLPTMPEPSREQAGLGSAQVNRITQEMLTAAVQQAMSSASTASTSSETAALSANQPRSSSSEGVIIELRNLGFTNDAHNIQALQLGNGNLEEAINILLSGALDD